MNRRKFLSTIGLCTASVALSTHVLLPAKISHPGFDPAESYGDFVLANDEMPTKVWINALDRQIEKHIPPEYRKEIVYLDTEYEDDSDPLRQYKRAYGWKYVPGRLRTVAARCGPQVVFS